MKLKFITAITTGMLLILPFKQTSAQSKCGFDDYDKTVFKNAATLNRVNAFEKIWQEVQERLMHPASQKFIISGADTIYEIPLVFHIINTGDSIGTMYNQSDAQIQAVVDYINKTYAATYPAYPDVTSGGVNMHIQFVLAKRDPNCRPTTGITRVNGVTALGANGAAYEAGGIGTGGVSDVLVKALDIWDANSYYNIWVVNKINGWDGYVAGSGTVGYATSPGGSLATDGTIIMASFNTAGERTLPHELGHAFSLMHTFSGGCVPASGCATNGDLVCDTDPHSQVEGCPNDNNPCTGTSWIPVVNNFMNYTDCVNRFTAGQRARARTSLLSLRGSLIQSLGGTDLSVPAVTYPQPIALTNCVPSAISNMNNVYDVGPENIIIGSLASYSNGYSRDNLRFYIDHNIATCIQPAIAPLNIVPGQSYPVAVGTGNNPENVRIWLDFNNDATFTSNELIFSSNGATGDVFRVHTGNTIVIPSTGIVTGTTLRMRVISDFYDNSNPSPCGNNIQYGQAEDFAAIISTPLSNPSLQLFAKANETTQQIDLQWKSSDEMHIKSYQVERSTDDQKTWQSLNGIIATKGNHAVYKMLDMHPSTEQVNFYRLKINTMSGSVDYSPITNAGFSNAEEGFHIYPNPANEKLMLKVPQSGLYSITISNALGQEVIHTQPKVYDSNEAAYFDVSKMAQGVYYFKITTQHGTSYVLKFVKH